MLMAEALAKIEQELRNTSPEKIQKFLLTVATLLYSHEGDGQPTNRYNPDSSHMNDDECISAISSLDALFTKLIALPESDINFDDEEEDEDDE